MNDKSHVSLEQHVCLICGTRFDTGASLELKEISHDETVPIRSVGQHSHKVWVRRKK